MDIADSREPSEQQWQAAHAHASDAPQATRPAPDRKQVQTADNSRRQAHGNEAASPAGAQLGRREERAQRRREEVRQIFDPYLDLETWDPFAESTRRHNHARDSQPTPYNAGKTATSVKGKGSSGHQGVHNPGQKGAGGDVRGAKRSKDGARQKKRKESTALDAFVVGSTEDFRDVFGGAG